MQKTPLVSLAAISLGLNCIPTRVLTGGLNKCGLLSS